MQRTLSSTCLRLFPPCHKFVLKTFICLVSRGKSARLELPAARCVSTSVPSARLFYFFKCESFNKRLHICEGTEPECRRTAGTLNYIKVDDCQSEQQIELHYCEVKDKMHARKHTHTRLMPPPLLPGLAYKLQ